MESGSPKRAAVVLTALIGVAAVANLNLPVANVALPVVLGMGLGELTKSFSSAADLANQPPGPTGQIIAAAIVSQEQELLKRYHAEDS